MAEVIWPARKKNEGEDSDSEIERLCARERLIAELRQTVEKAMLCFKREVAL